MDRHLDDVSIRQARWRVAKFFASSEGVLMTEKNITQNITSE